MVTPSLALESNKKRTFSSCKSLKVIYRIQSVLSVRFDFYESEAHDEAKFFCDKVQALRKEKGITQERLAELIEKSVEHVSYIERGERAPSFETILDIAEALEVTVPSNEFCSSSRE